MPKLSWLITGVSGTATAMAWAGLPAAAPPAGENPRVVSVITAMYAALQADNVAEYRSIISPDFYAFDQGRRYDGDALAKNIKALHARGYVFQWTVTEPEVHVDGDVAWATYINRGSIRDKRGEGPMTWQDSAVLERHDGHWRIRFLHSSPACAAR